MDNRKDEFLLEMYRQMFNDINRHLSLIWQAIGVLVGALALFALVEKGVVSLSISVSMIVLLCTWLLAHVLDSSYWYNRNLVIIANIERKFLDASDAKSIHYYFVSHRKGNRMMTQLQVQLALGIALAGLVLLYHFSKEVYPGLGAPWSGFQLERVLPYLVSIASVIYIYWFDGNRDASYDEFLKNSPGDNVDESGITFGPGHGRGKSFLSWLKDLVTLKNRTL